MSKPGLIALILSLCGGVALAWGATRIPAIGTRLNGMEQKLAALESAGGGGGAPRDPGATSAADRLSDEIVRLKSEIQELKAGLAKLVEDRSGGTGPTLADLNRALDEAIARIEKRQKVEGALADAKKAQAHNAALQKSLATSLQLTEAQYLEVGGILSEQVNRYREFWIEGGDAAAQAAKLKAINDETAAGIRGLLTEDQKRQFDVQKPKWFIE